MISSLNITLAQRSGNSYLKDAYVTQPFRIVPVGQYRRDSGAYLMIMSSSPGLLDKDHHQIQINLEESTKLHLETQAYQRLFTMKEGAKQSMTIAMNKGTSFSFVPHPVVPQSASSFVSHTTVNMEEDAHFLLSDIITCGRKLAGESFEYNHFQNLTEVFFKGKLVLKDNVLLQPQNHPIHQLGMLEGYTHQGTFLYVNTASYAVEKHIEDIFERYHAQADIAFGISKLSVDGFVIRVLAHGAEVLFDLFREIQKELWNEVMLPHTQQIAQE